MKLKLCITWGRGKIKKYLCFCSVKIAKILHRFSLRTNVYDIQVSQKSFFLFLKIFEYVVIERNKCNQFDNSFYCISWSVNI